MDHHHSRLIDSSSYDDRGLLSGLSVRMHRNLELELAGVARLRRDWKKYVGPPPANSTGGSLGPAYSFTSMTIPECLPNRLELVSYIIEFAFLHDDLVDTANVDEKDGINQQLKDALTMKSPRDEVPGLARIFLTILDQMKAVDAHGASEVLRCWSKDLGLQRNRPDIDTLDDHCEYRVVDCGNRLTISLLCFVMGLHIAPPEMDECVRLLRPLNIANALVNDVQSWAKEYAQYTRSSGASGITNAVFVVMKQDSVDEEAAKQLVLEKAKNLIRDYVDSAAQVRKSCDLSSDAWRLMEGWTHAVAGNAIWGFCCPRYYPEQALTEQQATVLAAEGCFDASFCEPDIFQIA